MIKIFQKIPLFFFTLINILKFYFLNIFERKKIIFFYFPVKAYSENILEINDKIKNSKKFKTYFSAKTMKE